MKLSDLGEGGLLELIRDWTASSREAVVLGAGDDAAVLELPGRGRHLVISTDAWVDDVHFSRKYLDPDEIGHRCMAGSLSDLAAMGAEGIAAFVNLHAPADTPLEFLRRAYQGMDRVADSCGVAIAGGDTVRGELAFGITAVGTAIPGQVVRRDGAGAGDVLCVSGELGGSEAGRLLLGEEIEDVPERMRSAALLQHRTPTPRFDVARLLLSLERRTVDMEREAEIVEPVRPTAMIDVSDGLAADLRRLCEASGVGCRLDAARVPVHAAARKIAEARGEPGVSLALSGGEDFELLFTMQAGDLDLLLEAAQEERIEISPIGTMVTAAEGLVVEGEDGPARDLPETGWDHFSPGRSPGGSGSPGA